MFRRPDPGPCPICGKAHTACTANTGPITVAQLPARDALPKGELEPPPLVAEVVQETLASGQVTSGTYRGNGRKRSR